MELLADRDPEEARQLLDPVLERMMAAVHRYEGTVNQVMGDGIMALFGAPIAHEDHAVRACYAALAMQEAIRRYSDEVRRAHGLEVQIRVGLNSGEVVVRAIGNDLHMDYSAIGQTTHLAARMEQLAPPGSIRLTAETLRLAEGWVQVTPLGPVPVKGLPAPVEVCELVGAGPARTRLQAFAARGLTPFVGRQAELAALHQALEQAGAGHGQVVAVIGEPGVGKTRLFHEFTHASRTQGWLLLESSSTSYGKATPYLPVIDLLKAYFQIEDRDDGRRMREKLTGRLLTLDPALGPTLPAFLALLEVPVEDPPWQALDPSQRRQRTLDALKRLLLRESQVQPLLLVFENLHWIDAETQAFLDGLVESLPAARLLLLVNYRPEYQHGWGSKTYYTQLRLDPLPPASAEALLQSLLGDDAGLEPLKQRLIERTQGNPFFLEESVRTLVETQVLVGEPGAYRLARALPSIQVPATVQAVLAARIDRLPPEEKQLLQTAAVIGTEVPLALLQAIAEVPEEPLRLGLTHLQAAEFLYETRLFPEHRVHLQARPHPAGGLRDAAPGAAARAPCPHRRGPGGARRRPGGRAGRTAGPPCPAGRGVGQGPGVLPAGGGEGHGAVGLPRGRGVLRAGAQCPPASAGDARHARAGHRSPARPALGAPAVWRLWAHPGVSARGRGPRGGPRRPASAGTGLCLSVSPFPYIRGAYDQAIAAAQRALALATAGGEVVLHALANHYLGTAYQAQGDYRRAIDCLGQTVASLDGAQRHERFGQVILPAVHSRAYLAGCHAELGTFAEGSALGEEGLRIAEAVAHPGSLMLASWGIGLLALRQGDLPRALPLLERAMGICQDADLPLFFPRMAAALGAAYTLAGRVADAVPLLTQAMEQTTATEMVGFQALCRLSLGEAQLLAGRLEEAHALAERALALAREHQERGHQAYALRLLGEIAARREPPEREQAEAYYRQALALAEELGMRPLVAHCHLGLGTLYATIGQRRAGPRRTVHRHRRCTAPWT